MARDRRGQALAEYVIALALIAIVCIGGFTAFGARMSATASGQAECVASLACGESGGGDDSEMFPSRSDTVDQAAVGPPSVWHQVGDAVKGTGTGILKWIYNSAIVGPPNMANTLADGLMALVGSDFRFGRFAEYELNSYETTTSNLLSLITIYRTIATVGPWAAEKTLAWYDSARRGAAATRAAKLGDEVVGVERAAVADPAAALRATGKQLPPVSPAEAHRLLRKYDTTPGIDTGQQIKFGQQGVSPGFTQAGSMKGKMIDEVVDLLRTGKLTPDDLPIQYIWVNGEKVAVNNRSLTALSKAGLKPTKTIDMTGRLPTEGNDTLPSVLRRLEDVTDNKPTTEIPIRASWDWNSQIVERVRLPR